jgi:hypothetical protein
MLSTKKTTMPTQAVAPVTQVRPASDMRHNLGLFNEWKVTRAERAAKADAAVTHVRRAVEISLDVAQTQLEIDATNLKCALVARAVPVLGAIEVELQSRSKQVANQLTALQLEGMLDEIELRHAYAEKIDQMQAAGLLTAEEAADARAFVEGAAASNCARLAKNTQQAHDALDSHVSRATDHIRTSQMG